MWCIDDEFHRVDGPAIQYVDGTVEYHLNGTMLTKAAFDKIQNKGK